MTNEPNINVSIKDTTEVECEKCKNKTFVERLFLRKVSRFATGMMEDGVIPIPVFACGECGHINKEFLPKDK